jgi:CrcB protein
VRVSEPTGPHIEPIDPDIDLHVPGQAGELARPVPVLASIAAGGVLGSLSRYGLQVAFPHAVAGFGWATFAINVSGCFLIGVLMVLITHRWPDRRLLRPFLGVGVLGGFTTFSAYAVDIDQAVLAGAAGTALAYLLATVVAALAAVWAGSTVARRFAA